MLFRKPQLRRLRAALALAPCLFFLATSATAAPPATTDTTTPNPARKLARAVQDPALRAYLEDVLARHPGIEARRAQVEALAHRPEQVGALPDPTLQTSLFALPPETRVGPQRLRVGVQQRLPSKTHRKLRRGDAELATRVARDGLRAAELRLVTEARELWLELAFIHTWRQILHEERGHLERHEEAARARYAAGTGLAQGPIMIQSELTRIDAETLDVDARRQSLLARLDALRDRWDAEPPANAGLPTVDGALVALVRDSAAETIEALTGTALENRPEFLAAKTQQQRAEVGEQLAETNSKPDFTVGLAWTLVENRQDDAGRANSPEDNGRDIFAVTGGMTLPLWRRPRKAELEEALARSTAAAAAARQAASDIRLEITDLVHRLPLEYRQLTLLRDVLERQAEEAVTSAVTAYATGRNNALDLLDAEHRLFEVRRAVARAQADVAISLAQLEGAQGQPLRKTKS